MSTFFLVLQVVGAVLVLNALRPIPGPLGVGSFALGFFTTELAPLSLLIHVVVTAAFAATGAVEGAAGTVGLVLAAFSAVGLVTLVAAAQRVHDVVEQALAEGLGDDYELAEREKVPWRPLLLPTTRHPDVERIRSVSYGPYGRRNQLDVYRHKDRPAGCPTLLQVHGGAWVVGSKDQQGKPLMTLLASKGWVCFAANYRLSPRAAFPDHLLDLKSVIAWIREHGPEYGADPGFLVVTGGSAGGHLTALLALTPNEPGYQPGFEDVDTSVSAAVPIYGVYDFTNAFGLRYAAQRNRFIERMVLKKKLSEARAEFERASPLWWLDNCPEVPPMFVIHGAGDTLVPVTEARNFVRRLREVSPNPVIYAELPGAQHAFEMLPSIRAAHVTRAVARFLEVVRKQAGVASKPAPAGRKRNG